MSIKRLLEQKHTKVLLTCLFFFTSLLLLLLTWLGKIAIGFWGAYALLWLGVLLWQQIRRKTN